MRKFAWLVRRHEKGMLAYFKLRITNASVEGLNNKAKGVSHRAYGFRTARTFITTPYLSMGNLPMPESTQRFV